MLFGAPDMEASLLYDAEPSPAAPVALLSLDGVVKHFGVKSSAIFRRRSRVIHAVNGVDLRLEEGRTLALVGESGSGKSTMARLAVGLSSPTSGRVVFDHRDLSTIPAKEMSAIRRNLQIVFQNPYGSLHPHMKVADLVAEPLIVHKLLSGPERMKKVGETLERVSLGSHLWNRRPSQLSGGQRQRVAIARALVLQPKVLVLDEPTSALDVSIRGQILNLLSDLRQDMKLTCLLISHDLGAVRYLADRVAVMYAGVIVEEGTVNQIYEYAKHPYTQALLAAEFPPEPHMRDRKRQIIVSGEIPDAANPISGCRFRTRCWKAQAVCSQEEPALVAQADGHRSRCYFPC
jgi:oligopeptide transport system ATP-binding protein